MPNDDMDARHTSLSFALGLMRDREMRDCTVGNLIAEAEKIYQWLTKGEEVNSEEAARGATAGS